jgi:hypothetical protein
MIMNDNFDPLEFLRKKQDQQDGSVPPVVNPAQVSAPAAFDFEDSALGGALKTEAPDQIIADSTKKRQQLSVQQSDLQNQAGEAAQFSDKEKLASGLALALPGLLGAIVGGVLGGPQGALAGLGGGASGGVEGVKDLQKRKDAQSKGLTDQANQLAARIDAADAEIMRRKDRLEDRSLSKEQKEKELAQIERLTKVKLDSEEKQLGRKLTADERLNSANNTARRGDILLNNAGSLQREQMDTERALLLAGEQAKKEVNIKASKDAKLSPADESFKVNVNMAGKFLNDLEAAVNNGGTYETIAGNPNTKSVLDSTPYKLAITYAKIVDPASVAREGEVEAAKKFLIPLGPTVPTSIAKAHIDLMRNTIKQYAQERDLPTDKIESTSSTSNTSAPQQTKKQKYGF